MPDTDPHTLPPRQTGVGHVFAAGGYSLGGLTRLWQEAAFRHEVLAFALLLPVYIAAGARPFEIFLFIGLFLILAAVEALNTAVEDIVNRVSPEWSEMGRDAKNLGSLAVMFLLLAHGLLLAWVIIT
ncbi:diacylglycerol kinase [Paenirhodobacter sp. CAU 1674]|uniref:diacylglycerol kinase n=1 Tax=Paenirhodobacter sp. CAU 1674 TaxID=3032596 RepID=UPI0023DA7490|nr:diacylglycerol kinase [Paenirhodobacter sp. CAU 1674]MDF2141605.1 diacylglycerol kinase [Paenirhodobacter sp. CAU 1674]